MRTFTIIIPIYRDLQYVKDKVSNILDFDYPADKVEVIFAHGGAKSNKDQEIRAEDPLCRILHRQGYGKIYQLNEAIKAAHGQIMLITDIDARMPADSLRAINADFDEDPSVAVVGAWTYPMNCTLVDRIYWYIANWLRILEQWILTCSHVSGCCMAFHRFMIERFPDDVIADDVYIPFLANFNDLRTVYLKDVKVAEIRQPKTIGDFFMHKTRKGNAVLRELLRFMYLLQQAKIRWKLIYLARMIQFTILTPTVFLSYPFYQQTSKLRKVK